MNFIIVPAKNPTKEPKAARTAFLKSEFCVSSPVNAPKKGPKTSPIGPKKNPMRRPMPEPMVPIRVPPSFCVPHTGSKASSKKMTRAIINVSVKKVVFDGTLSVRWSTSKPSQLQTGPGMMGKKLAATPNRISRPLKMSNMMSME